MTLVEYLALNTDTGGVQDYYETVVGLRPVSNAHPPSLRNPQKVKIPMSQDGWHPGDSNQARAKAKQDLLRALEQGQRQIGIPQGATTAQMPVFPSIDKWF